MNYFRKFELKLQPLLLQLEDLLLVELSDLLIDVGLLKMPSDGSRWELSLPGQASPLLPPSAPSPSLAPPPPPSAPP